MRALLAQTPDGIGALLMVLIYWWPVILALVALVGAVAYFHWRRNRSQKDTSLNL